MITGKTKLLAVIGQPIAHSLSPVMHNAAIAAVGVDYVYVALPIQPADLAAAIAGFAAIDLQGFSVTIPHKQAILPFLTEITDMAQAVGAVNTVWRTDRGWSGTNTDVAGFIAPLKTRPVNWRETTALVLGNGGAARAVVVGLTQLGCAEIHVVGRDRLKLAAFQQGWSSPYRDRLQVHLWDDLSPMLSGAGLVVNTTPIGMSPHADHSPLTPAQIKQLPSDSIAYDLIYSPNPTVFLQQAQAQGMQAIDGLEMLVQQGAAALEIWLQQPAPIAVMRAALQTHLGL